MSLKVDASRGSSAGHGDLSVAEIKSQQAAVETAKAHNIISGYNGNQFALWENAKRGQICKILDGALP